MPKEESCFKKILRWLDIFKVPISFNIGKEEEYSTISGGIAFIIYVGICVYFLLTNFLDFVSRVKFNQNTINNYLETPGKIDIFNKKMRFATGITVNGVPLDKDDPLSQYLYIESYHVQKFKENNTKLRRPLNLTNCKKSNFNGYLDEEFEINNLDQMNCIDQEYNNGTGNNMYLSGLYTDHLFQYIELSICAHKNVSDNILRDIFLDKQVSIQFYYLDSSINMSNFEKPEKLFLNSKYITLFHEFLTKANIDFAENSFENDANILISSPKKFYFYTVENYKEWIEYEGTNRFEEGKSNAWLMARFYIRSSSTTVDYKRTYQKFTEYLADSTSIVSEILVILVLVFEEYDKFKAKEYIINNMLKYKIKFQNDNPKSFYLLKSLFNEKVNEEALNYRRRMMHLSKSSTVPLEEGSKSPKNSRKNINLDFIGTISSYDNDDDNDNKINLNDYNNIYNEIYNQSEENLRNNEQKRPTSPKIKVSFNMNVNQTDLNMNSNNINLEKFKNSKSITNNFHSNTQNQSILIGRNVGRLSNNHLTTIHNHESMGTQRRTRTTVKKNNLLSLKENDCLYKIAQKENKLYNPIKIDKSMPLYISYLSQAAKAKFKSNDNLPEMMNNLKEGKGKENPANETLDYSICDLVKSILYKIGCCCCRKNSKVINKTKLVDKGEERFLEFLDIFNYFGKLREVDILKHILLTSSQATLINFLSKPSISLIIKDSDSPINKSLCFFENTCQNVENLYNSFYKCSKEYEETNNEISKKLLKLTSYELYQLIEEKNLD